MCVIVSSELPGLINVQHFHESQFSQFLKLYIGNATGPEHVSAIAFCVDDGKMTYLGCISGYRMSVVSHSPAFMFIEFSWVIFRL